VKIKMEMIKENQNVIRMNKCAVQELRPEIMEDTVEQEDSVAHLNNWFAWTAMEHQPKINLA
jgi:hypothetical protein